MKTLLQTLLIETLPTDEEDSVLRSFIDTILPAMERVFALTPALGGSEEKFANKADQSLLVHVLNGLLTAWNLSENLFEPLSEVEQRLLCLGFTLHDYDKYFHGQGKEELRAHQVSEIIERCQELGEMLSFQDFWTEWKQYLLDICFLAQNTQPKRGSNRISSNWEINGQTLMLDYSELDRLCELLAFGDVAVHMNDPADIFNVKAGNKKRSSGEALRDHLDWLGIDKKLVYHRLRDCRGLLTNQIHNAVVKFARELKWEPILYFAQGAVYLAPPNPAIPSLADIQETVWESLIKGEEESNQRGLEDYFSSGDVGFVRDGKGLKIAPQTLELFTPAELIRQLPEVVKVKVANVKGPATPKRIEKLTLSDEKREFLAQGADIWADRLAEFIILAQKEFFEGCEEYIVWVLTALELQSEMLPEQTQVQSGGVNYGWYQAAAHYIAARPELDRHPGSEDLSGLLSNLGDRLATWAEENKLLPVHTSPTREALFNYLAQYLEVSAWEQETSEFQSELTAYTKAKTTNQPICSLSSGEFAAEEQLDSVVLFKPQQYSNKNTLGGRRIKRGISKIWSLEMLLRQAYWSVPAGKLEEQQPVFLYMFPAYVYSPQTAVAVRRLVKKLKKVNLWEVRKQWLDTGMHYSGLQNLAWREGDEVKAGRYGDGYSTRDLPFMAMSYTTTRGKTITDAWVEPAFLALALPMLLGVKVVVTSSPDPLYASDKEFLSSVILDGPAGFWNLLGLPTSLRLQDLSNALDRLLVSYCLHLDSRSSPPDARWQDLVKTVRDMTTNVLNVFSLANQGLRRNKHERPSLEEVERFWKYAQIWAKGDKYMDLIEKLVDEYRKFYRIRESESSHAILLPVSIAIDTILSTPNQVSLEDLILQAAGQLRDALDRREVYRPILMDKSVDYPTRQAQELVAIKTFINTCIKELFMGVYKGDRALLQENRNRIKSGAEFAYRWLALQEKSSKSQSEGKTK